MSILDAARLALPAPARAPAPLRADHARHRDRRRGGDPARRAWQRAAAQLQRPSARSRPRSPSRPPRAACPAAAGSGHDRRRHRGAARPGGGPRVASVTPVVAGTALLQNGDAGPFVPCRGTRPTSSRAPTATSPVGSAFDESQVRSAANRRARPEPGRQLFGGDAGAMARRSASTGRFSRSIGVGEQRTASGRRRDHAAGRPRAVPARQRRHREHHGREGVSTDAVTDAIAQSRDILSERHDINDPADADFRSPRCRACSTRLNAVHRLPHPLHRRGGGDLAGGRRHRDHEHHAGLGHRADAGDRHPQGRRRQPRRRSSSSSFSSRSSVIGVSAGCSGSASASACAARAAPCCRSRSRTSPRRSVDRLDAGLLLVA